MASPAGLAVARRRGLAAALAQWQPVPHWGLQLRLLQVGILQPKHQKDPLCPLTPLGEATGLQLAHCRAPARPLALQAGPPTLQPESQRAQLCPLAQQTEARGLQLAHRRDPARLLAAGAPIHLVSDQRHLPLRLELLAVLSSALKN